jgi:hypothetical protein
MLPKSGSATSGVEHENKGDGMATDGLRTERVTLEVTYDNRISNNPHAWNWSLYADAYRVGGLLSGESVRVVGDEERQNEMSNMEDTLKGQRDAAIRERDAYQGEYYKLRAAKITQALTADRFASAVQEADTLRARVAELEAAAKLASHANADGEANHAVQAASGGGEGE